MNAQWHSRHVLRKGSSVEQRIAWHREHQRRCACRPIPLGLQKEMARPAGKRRDPAIDAYLSTVGPTNRGLLKQLRKTIHTIVPAVEECVSYRLPAFRLQGKIVAGFAATAKGCSFYPFSGTTLDTLAPALDGYGRTKGALHFGPDQPLPAALVRKLIKARMAERR